MFLIKWFGQSSVPASKNSGAADKLRGGRGTRRRRSQPLSWEVLEARQLLAHATIAPAAVQHPASLVAGLAPAASRTAILDPTLETLFLEGVERQVVGITPSPGLVAPYLKRLEEGVPQVRVLQRLLDSTAARDATVTDAYELLLHRDPSAAEHRAMTTKLDRGADLRRLLISLASSREFYVSLGAGTRAGFLKALKADLLGPTHGSECPNCPGGTPGRPGHRTRSALARAIVFSKEFNNLWLRDLPAIDHGAPPWQPPGSSSGPGTRKLRRPGGMTRAAGHPARVGLGTRALRPEREAGRAPRTAEPDTIPHSGHARARPRACP